MNLLYLVVVVINIAIIQLFRLPLPYQGFLSSNYFMLMFAIELAVTKWHQDFGAPYLYRLFDPLGISKCSRLIPIVDCLRSLVLHSNDIGFVLSYNLSPVYFIAFASSEFAIF